MTSDGKRESGYGATERRTVPSFWSVALADKRWEPLHSDLERWLLHSTARGGTSIEPRWDASLPRAEGRVRRGTHDPEDHGRDLRWARRGGLGRPSIHRSSAGERMPAPRRDELDVVRLGLRRCEREQPLALLAEVARDRRRQRAERLDHQRGMPPLLRH